MSETAIFDTAQMLRTHIGQVLGGVNDIHIGAPLRSEVGQARVSIFPFHFQVNKELRNEQRFRAPPLLEPPSSRRQPIDSLPLDIKFLITVFRIPDASSPSPNELTTLGLIVQRLQAQPNLVGENMNGQVVRLSPEPYPMEELSRIWGLFGQDVYRSSMVYLASPVMVEAGNLAAGVPVQEHTQNAGIDPNPPQLAGAG
ncbi:MAG: Pvc16 family protein [Pseudomonadales bacterium]